MDVQWTEIQLPILGMNEGLDDRILPPGEFVSVVNGEYSKAGTIRKRPGISRRCSSAGNDSPEGYRIVRHGNQLAVIDITETFAIRQFNQNQQAYPELAGAGQAPIPTATVRQREVENDLTTDTVVDVAGTTNGYVVYGMISCDTTSTQQCRVRVVEAASGAVVYSDRVVPTRNVRHVRAAANGELVLVTFSGDGTTDTGIEGVVVDCSFANDDQIVVIGASSNPTTTVDLATDVDQSATWFGHDSAKLGTANDWVVAYRRNAPVSVRLMKVTLTGSTLSTSFQDVYLGGFPIMISVAIANNDQDIVTNWFDLDAAGTGTLKYGVNNGTTLGTVLFPIVWENLTTVTPLATTIGRYQAGSVDDFVLFASHTELYSPPNSKWTPITRTASASRAGIVSPIQIKRRYCISSKPWSIGDSQHAWVLVSDDNGLVEFEGPDDQHIYSHVLLSFQNNPDETYGGILTNTWRPSVETSGFPDIAAGPGAATQAFVVGHQHLPQSHAIVNGIYYTVQHRTYVINEPRIGPIEYQVRYNHLGRYSNAEFGGDTYCTGGVVTEWDGTRLYEVGAVMAPEITVRLDTTGGTWAGDAGQYQYTAVYEFVDGLGNMHRSLIAPPKTITVGATDKVLITLEPLTLTRLQRNASVGEFPRIFVSIYRTTLAPGGGSEIFQRLLRYDQMPINLVNNPGSPTVLTFTDTGFDNTTNVPLYTTSGEIENDTVFGGATTLCVHKDRLWFGGGIDPEVIWYSKPRTDGLPAEFSIGQTIRIPGEEVIALGSLDEVLIVFCTKGIYRIGGEGPSAAGTGEAFGIPSILDQYTRCSGPRSVVSCPIGLLFQSELGICLLDHKQVINYIGENVEDTFNLYPFVKGAITDAARGEVLFALSDIDETAGTVLVYNYLSNLWSTWNHIRNSETNQSGLIKPWADISLWSGHEIAYLDFDGNLYEQQEAAQVFSDNLFFYPLDVETGWLSFSRLMGFKKLRKIGFLLERFNAHGMKIGFKFAYNETETNSKTWLSSEITNIGSVEWLRMTVPRQKSASIKIRITEQQAAAILEVGQFADTKGFAIQGIAFELGILAGLQKQPALNTG
jgi:hypothetical protein